MLDWDDLRYFLAVAREGSTLAAAKVLGVNQCRRGHGMDLHPRVEHFFIIRALCPADQKLIALRRHHEMHVDATARGAGDRRQERGIRDEIGRGDHRPRARRI